MLICADACLSVITLLIRCTKAVKVGAVTEREANQLAASL